MRFSNSGRIKVTPSYVITWWNRETQPINRKTPKSKPRSGYLSSDSMKRLRLRINLMTYIAENKTLRKSMNLPITKYKLVLITLTLSSSQIHSDYIIKSKLLQPFLRLLRNRWKVKNYLWKAEAQDNGNIHFHITTDQFIHWEEIRTAWNSIQETLGYISRAGNGNPNSTDIHAVYKCKNLSAYLCSYISKKDLYKKDKEVKQWSEHYYSNLLNITGCDIATQKEVRIKREIEGKLYDCNKELKSINPIWESHRALHEEIEEERERGSKAIDQDFYQITFIKKINSSEHSNLKHVLDTFIKYAYTGKKEVIVYDK